MSTTDDAKVVQEHLELQREFREYVAKHGFDYAQYCAPSPGSYYESYRKRWTELTHKLIPTPQ